MNSSELSPEVALIFFLAKRGSVLPRTFEQCKDRINAGFEISDKDHELVEWSQWLAKELTAAQ